MARFTLQQILDDLLGPLETCRFIGDCWDLLWVCKPGAGTLLTAAGFSLRAMPLSLLRWLHLPYRGLLEAVGQHRGGLQEKDAPEVEQKSSARKAAGLIYSPCVFLCVSQHGFLFVHEVFCHFFCISIRVELLFGKMFTDLILPSSSLRLGKHPCLHQPFSSWMQWDGRNRWIQTPAACPTLLYFAWRGFRHCPLGAANWGKGSICRTCDGNAAQERVKLVKTGEGVSGAGAWAEPLKDWKSFSNKILEN